MMPLLLKLLRGSAVPIDKRNSSSSSFLQSAERKEKGEGALLFFHPSITFTLETPHPIWTGERNPKNRNQRRRKNGNVPGRKEPFCSPKSNKTLQRDLCGW